MTNEFHLLKEDIKRVETSVQKQLNELHKDVKSIMFNNGKLFGINIAMGFLLPIVVTIIIEVLKK